MKKLSSLALALILLSACQGAPVFVGFPTPVPATEAAAPALAPPNLTMLRTYLLQPDDMADGYNSSEVSSALSLENAFASVPELKPAATASVAFQLESFDVLALLTRPVAISQTVMWYHNPTLAQAAYRIAEASAREAMTSEWGAETLEEVHLTVGGTDTVSYRATHKLGSASGMAYMVLVRKGPFVSALFVLGLGSGLSDGAVADLARTAAEGLPG